MNNDEISALITIVNRAPTTMAEKLWLAGFIQRVVSELDELDRLRKQQGNTERDSAAEKAA